MCRLSLSLTHTQTLKHTHKISHTSTGLVSPSKGCSSCDVGDGEDDGVHDPGGVSPSKVTFLSDVRRFSKDLDFFMIPLLPGLSRSSSSGLVWSCGESCDRAGSSGRGSTEDGVISHCSFLCLRETHANLQISSHSEVKQLLSTTTKECR